MAAARSLFATLACAVLSPHFGHAATQDARLGALDVLDVSSVLSDVESAFQQWAAVHGKEYADDDERDSRRGNFEANAHFIAEHNSRYDNVRLALNEFADFTFEEFAQTRLGVDVSLKSEKPHDGLLGTFRYADAQTPSEVDWVAKGAVTGVKNQGQCGSCWAFSTTGSIEGVNFLDTGVLKPISEQELVDCDKSHDNGCGGGLMDNAFQYVLDNGGLDSERDYSYWGAFPSFCNRRKQGDRHVVDITGFEDVPHGDEDALARAAANQPVSVAICANNALMFYHSGVFDAECCDGLNHGVLLVGYGTADADEGGSDFWKVKNSWGLGWGEQGYFRLKRGVGSGGQCGIAKMASYPVRPLTRRLC
jgi:Papain family cysteine protease/Cathepsin propeptide inhibitor domain (I29)